MSETEHLLERRARLLGPNVATFYEDPVNLVRGKGVWVWDKAGQRYLDCYNNVPHLGHCHPRVVTAICEQAATLNTHTRYLHEGILDYIEALTETLDASLSTALMTCTGSEANDVALRMARAISGGTGVIATDHTYHGNTTAVSQLSRTSPPAGGYWDNIAFVPAPDSYRPLGGVAGMEHAQLFAAAVENQIAALSDRGHSLSALVVCPYFANEGMPDLPRGWLDPAIAVVRRAGGVIIADEVQPGFGRLGSHFWGHQRMGFVPEIMTIGKPMANGHPVGAVLTSGNSMREFRENFKYFNTFGGNPVSVAAAMATLRTLQDEGLMENAATVGSYLRDSLRALAERHITIGDVRGAGLFLGVELVSDRTARTAAPELAARIVNALRRNGILLSTSGIGGNVLKIRPPMPFSRDNADFLVETLERVLSDASITA